MEGSKSSSEWQDASLASSETLGRYLRIASAVVLNGVEHG